MNLYDRIHGAEPRKFLRFVYEFEVEVTDRTQVAAYMMDATFNEAGELGVRPHLNQNAQVHAAVSRSLARALDTAGPQVGFRILSMGLLPRPVTEEGRHPEITFDSMPARLDDGSPASDEP